MGCTYKVLSCLILLNLSLSAATKPHVVTIGRWTSIFLRTQDSGGHVTQIKIRPLYVDGWAKEFTIGVAHEVTDRTFVVQRIYRVNDSLPQQPGATQWQWQLGGWLLVDRVSGKIQPIALPDFDPDSSAVNWFRDYAAYCGVSDDGGKLFVMITQIGRRKALLKKAAGDANDSQPACAPPIWERNPVRVTFAPEPDQKITFAVKSRAIDLVSPDESEVGD